MQPREPLKSYNPAETNEFQDLRMILRKHGSPGGILLLIDDDIELLRDDLNAPEFEGAITRWYAVWRNKPAHRFLRFITNRWKGMHPQILKEPFYSQWIDCYTELEFDGVGCA